jgi:hypothetical protein
VNAAIPMTMKMGRRQATVLLDTHLIPSRNIIVRMLQQQIIESLVMRQDVILV